MKTCVSFGLLVLLLSHSMGSSVAMLCLGAADRRLPVTEQNDLLVTPSAWHRFAELSETLQEMDQSNGTPTPLGSILKMLNDLAKTYLPVQDFQRECEDVLVLPKKPVRFAERHSVAPASIFKRATPPPEMIV